MVATLPTLVDSGGNKAEARLFSLPPVGRTSTPSTGTYAILVDLQSGATGAFSVTLSETLTIAAGGPPVALGIATAGETASLHFTMTQTQGKSIALLADNLGITPVTVSITDPAGGTVLTSTSLTGSTCITRPGTSSTCAFVDPISLQGRPTGVYTLLVDPPGNSVGSLSLTLFDVPPPMTTTITPSGPPVQVAVETPGQTAQVSFTTQAGHRYAVSVTGLTAIPTNFSIQNAQGQTIVGPQALATATGFIDPPSQMLSAGTYTIIVDPIGVANGTARLSLVEVPADVTDTITPTNAGSTKTVTTAAGQNARLTFVGPTSGRVSVKLENVTATTLYASIRTDPNNPATTLASSGPFTTSTGFIDLTNVQAGTSYTLLLDPQGTATGSATVTVYDVPADPTPTVMIGGPAQTVTLTVPGQNGAPTFSVTTTQPLNLTVSNVTIAASHISVLNPSGTNVLPGGAWAVGTAGGTKAFTASTVGTYTIKIDADGANIGSMNVAVTVGGRGEVGSAVYAGDDPGDPLHSASLATQADQWVPAGPNLRGDWRSHWPESAATMLPPLAAPGGVTAVTGQVLAIRGDPLPNVKVSVEDRTMYTDQTGRFLLAGVPAGRVELLVDGTSANEPGRSYGIFEIGVDAVAGQTTQLDQPVWMQPIDTPHAKRIMSPTTSEVVVTTPHIRDLELHIPAGASVVDHDGKEVTEVSITAIPLDRAPFPLPGRVVVPVYFTIQPGAAYVRGPAAWLVYPNYTGERPGTRMDFWRYDPEEGWAVYGKGTVTPNGRQVVPDPGVGIYEFTGAMIATPPTGSPKGVAPGGAIWGGDPIDLGTGLFVYSKTDLALPGPLPLEVTRTYQQSDTIHSRAFGVHGQ